MPGFETRAAYMFSNCWHKRLDGYVRCSPLHHTWSLLLGFAGRFEQGGFGTSGPGWLVALRNLCDYLNTMGRVGQPVMWD